MSTLAIRPALYYNASVPETAVKKATYKKGNRLFHSTHGSCQIKEVITQTSAGKSQSYYSLESKQTRFKGVRFLVDVHQVETSGFHPLLTVKEANKIVDYLKTANAKDAQLGVEQPKKILSLIQENNPWSFARVVLIFAREKDGKDAKGRREMLTRAARGLIHELSFSLEVLEEEAVPIIKKSLKSRKANSWVLDAISNVLV